MMEVLSEEIKKSHQIDWMVSFIKTSGVNLLEDLLRQAVRRGTSIRIITGTYLGITEPAALYRLKTILGDSGEIYLFRDQRISFHPKAYFFTQANRRSVFVGSSNISKSALIQAVEWNYRIDEAEDPEGYSHFRNQYERILNHESDYLDDDRLKAYAIRWVKPQTDFDADDETKESSKNIYEDHHSDPDYVVTRLIRPNDAQIEALYELSSLRKMGSDKSLVAAATGVGKTYLAAFDSKEFKRVLFIAHREEILRQSARTFHLVRPNNSIGFISGDQKDWEKDMVFASI